MSSGSPSYADAVGDPRDRMCDHTWKGETAFEEHASGRSCKLCGFYLPLLDGWDTDAALANWIGPHE